jgi:hypothetical protein
MRLVFVNHCHPDTPHVCATRMREFAKSMAARGHKIILFTETLETGPAEISSEESAGLIQSHDFSTPLYIASAPTGHPLIQSLRNRTLPSGVRQAVVVWHYLRHKGVFTDWRHGSQPYLQTIADTFKPDLVWSTFGNTDCWNIAQDLAKFTGCPWLGDVKDPWGNFIPAIFQNYLSRHFDDSAALTTFSEFHSKDASKWFSPPANLIYSGFSHDCLESSKTVEPEKLVISLTGAIYDDIALSQLIQGIRDWIMDLPDDQRARVRLIYAGQDSENVEAATGILLDLCEVDIKGFVSLTELGAIHQSAIANLYIKNSFTFHHKTIEMLSAGRPLICFPEETEEAKNIAGSTQVPLLSCATPEEVTIALNQSMSNGQIDVQDDEGLRNLTWEAQSEKLEKVFKDVLSEDGSHG